MTGAENPVSNQPQDHAYKLVDFISLDWLILLGNEKRARNKKADMSYEIFTYHTKLKLLIIWC